MRERTQLLLRMQVERSETPAVLVSVEGVELMAAPSETTGRLLGPVVQNRLPTLEEGGMEEAVEVEIIGEAAVAEVACRADKVDPLMPAARVEPTILAPR
ncbi:hypothetical protein [Acidithiobacillus caldus]|nr:hypothetical protein [Acidithiobacillus caldus]OFC62643.1 hypothetical protein BAE30_01700 [Acidithiobacillus caldus]